MGSDKGQRLRQRPINHLPQLGRTARLPFPRRSSTRRSGHGLVLGLGVLVALFCIGTPVAAHPGSHASSLAASSARDSSQPLAGKTGSAAKPKPVLRIGLNSAPASLDPAKDTGRDQTTLRSLSHASITHLRPDGSYGPGLATSWRYIGRGNKNFEFTLRPNARFSDGTPVTAQAVKVWFNYFRGVNGGNTAALGPIRSIETIGKWTVRLHLRSPNPVIPLVLSDMQYFWGAISSPKAVATPSILGTRTFGAGPYVLLPSQTVAGDTYTYVPNKFFFDKSKIRFSKVIVKIIASPSSMLQAMNSGQLDVASGDVSTAAAAERGGLNIIRASGGFVGMIFLDRNGTVVKPLEDVRVRQALNYAIDRKTITQALVGKFGTPTSQVSTLDGSQLKYQNFYGYNPARAKSLLAEAGYSNGFSFDVVVPGYLGNFGTPVAQAVAKYLAAVGVRVTIISAATVAEFIQKGLRGEVPALGTNLTIRPVWTLYSQMLAPNGSLNPFRVNDAAFNKLFLQGQRAANPSTYWKQLTARLTTQAVALPVFKIAAIFYASRNIGGVAMTERSLGIPLAADWFPK